MTTPNKYTMPSPNLNSFKFGIHFQDTGDKQSQEANGNMMI